MVRRIGVAEVKARLAEVLRGVEIKGESVIVERRGQPVAIIQPYDPNEHVARHVHWTEQLEGIAADIEDFEEVMNEVIASRASTGTRNIDLDQEE